MARCVIFLLYICFFFDIFMMPLNKDGFQAIEIPEDNEAKIATIGVLKYIIC